MMVEVLSDLSRQVKNDCTLISNVKTLGIGPNGGLLIN